MSTIGSLIRILITFPILVLKPILFGGAKKGAEFVVSRTLSRVGLFKLNTSIRRPKSGIIEVNTVDNSGSLVFSAYLDSTGHSFFIPLLFHKELYFRYLDISLDLTRVDNGKNIKNNKRNTRKREREKRRKYRREKREEKRGKIEQNNNNDKEKNKNEDIKRKNIARKKEKSRDFKIESLNCSFTTSTANIAVKANNVSSVKIGDGNKIVCELASLKIDKSRKDIDFRVEIEGFNLELSYIFFKSVNLFINNSKKLSIKNLYILMSSDVNEKSERISIITNSNVTLDIDVKFVEFISIVLIPLINELIDVTDFHFENEEEKEDMNTTASIKQLLSNLPNTLFTIPNIVLTISSDDSNNYPEVPSPGELVSIGETDAEHLKDNRVLNDFKDFEFYYLFGHESRGAIDKSARDYGFEKIKNLRYKTFDIVSKDIINERLGILIKRTIKDIVNPSIVLICRAYEVHGEQNIEIVLDADWYKDTLNARVDRLIETNPLGTYFDYKKVPRILPLYFSGLLKLQSNYSVESNRCQLYVSWELALLVSFIYRLMITVFERNDGYKSLQYLINKYQDKEPDQQERDTILNKYSGKEAHENIPNNEEKVNNTKNKSNVSSVNSPFLPNSERFPSAILNNLTLLVILNKYATPYATSKQIIFNRPPNIFTPIGSLFYIPYGLNLRTGTLSGTAFYKQFGTSTDDFLGGCTRIFLGKTAIFNTLPDMHKEMMDEIKNRGLTIPKSISYIVENQEMNNPVLPIDTIRENGKDEGKNGKVIEFKQPHYDLEEVPAIGHINLPLLVYEKTYFIKSYCYYFGNYVYNSSLTGFESMKAIGQYLPVIVAGTRPVFFFNLTIGILDKLLLEQAINKAEMRLDSLVRLQNIFRNEVLDKIREAVLSFYEVTNDEVRAISLLKEIKNEIILSKFKHPLLNFGGERNFSEFSLAYSQGLELEFKYVAPELWKSFLNIFTTEWINKPIKSQKKKQDTMYRMSSCVKGPGVFKLARDGREFNQVARTFVNYARKHWKPVIVPSLPYDRYYKTNLPSYSQQEYPILPPISVPMVVEFAKLTVKYLIPYRFPLISTNGCEYSNNDEDLSNPNLLKRADRSYYDEDENYLSYKEWMGKKMENEANTGNYDQLIDYDTIPFKIVIHDGSVQIDVLRIFPATNIYASPSSDGILNQLLRPKLTPMTSNCRVMTLQKNLGPVWGRYGVYINASRVAIKFCGSIITFNNIDSPHSIANSIDFPRLLAYLSYTFEELFIRMAANPSVFQIAKFPVGVFSFGKVNMIRITSQIDNLDIRLVNPVDKNIKTYIKAKNFSFSHYDFMSKLNVDNIDLLANDEVLLTDNIEMFIPKTEITLKYCCDKEKLEKSLLVFHPSLRIESYKNHISLEFIKRLYVRWRCIMNIEIKDKVRTEFGTNITYASYLSLLLGRMANKYYLNPLFGVARSLELNSSTDPTVTELCVLKHKHEPRYGKDNRILRDWTDKMLIEGFRIEDVVLKITKFRTDLAILNNKVSKCFRSKLVLRDINICFDLFYNQIKFDVSLFVNKSSLVIKNVQIITVYKSVMQDNSNEDYMNDHVLIEYSPYTHPDFMLNEFKIESIDSELKVGGIYYFKLIGNALGIIFRATTPNIPGYPVYSSNKGLTSIFDTSIDINTCKIKFDNFGAPNKLYLVNSYGNKLILSNRVKKTIDIGLKIMFESSYKRDLLLMLIQIGYEKRDLINNTITDRLMVVVDPLKISMAPQELFDLTVMIKTFLRYFGQLSSDWGDDMEKINKKIMNDKLFNRLFYCMNWLKFIDSVPTKQKTLPLMLNNEESYEDEFKRILSKREKEYDSRVVFKPFNHSSVLQVPLLSLSIPTVFEYDSADTLSYGLLLELEYLTITLNTLKNLLKKENFDRIIHNNFTFSLTVQKLRACVRIAPESFNEFIITDKNIEETITRIYINHLAKQGKKLSVRAEDEIRNTIGFYSSVLPPLAYKTILTSDIQNQKSQIVYYFNQSTETEPDISFSYIGNSNEIYNSLTKSVLIERSIDYCKMDVKPLYFYIEEGLAILLKYTFNQMHSINSKNGRNTLIDQKKTKKVSEPIRIKYFEMGNINIRFQYNKSQNFLTKQFIERNSLTQQNSLYRVNEGLFRLYKNIERINISVDYPTRISLGFSTLSGTKIIINNIALKHKDPRKTTYTISEIMKSISGGFVSDIRAQVPFLFIKAPIRMLNRQFNSRYKVRRETYKQKRK